MKKQKYTSKIKNTACVCACACVLIFVTNSFADIKSDLDSLANQARHVGDEFMQQSVESRLAYEYRQGFNSDAQAQSLRQLTKKASDELEEICRGQDKIKKQIENYNGEDWDSRFGDSGVWRMLSGDICNTMILKCQIDYYQAAASDRLEQSRILNRSLDQLSTLPDVPNVQLVKADTYALLGRSDDSSKKLAGELYRKVLATEKLPDEVYYMAAVAAQKLNPPGSPQVLDELAARIDRTACRDNFELKMALAFLQRRLGSTKILEKNLKRWPQTREFVGNLILSDLTAQAPSQVSKLNVFEADCAAGAALQNEPAKYRVVLEAMSQVPDLQTGRVLYAAAVADTQQVPAKAIELFIKASGAPREPNDTGEPAASIAKKGAALAINFFKSEPTKYELVRRAVENYFGLAGVAIDEQIEYSYSDVLTDCGDTAAAVKLLQKIAKSNSAFRPHAKHDLSMFVIKKSQAVFELGQLPEAAKLLTAADVNVCDCRALALNLLTRYADRIDEYADSDSAVDAFDEIGRRAIDCSDEQGWPYMAVLYAHAAIFASRGQKGKLATVEKLLASLDKAFAENNMDVLTARARLASAQGKYESAAKQWGAICGMLKSDPNEPPQHSYHWWQAKYFELENSLKMPGVLRGDIIHSIEVLQSSFNQIPPFWDKKFKALAASR